MSDVSDVSETGLGLIDSPWFDSMRDHFQEARAQGAEWYCFPRHDQTEGDRARLGADGVGGFFWAQMNLDPEVDPDFVRLI